MRLKSIVIPILVIAYSVQGQDTLRTLFLGNSYTGYNSLPFMFQDLAESGGHPSVIDYNPPGGFWLEDHVDDQRSIGKISLGGWDYVILQEQSQVPTIDYWRNNSMYPSADYLDSTITANGGNTAFFMTWGRRNGGQQSIGGYSSPVFEDYFHMQDSLASAYTEISEMLSATLCPVGLCWATAVTLNPEIELWAPDEAHPSLLGSYLAACTFYGVFFDESPVGLTYTAGLTLEEAEFLQNAAYLTLGVKSQNLSEIPGVFSLFANYPNPFNSSTRIQFTLLHEADVKLRLFDNLGRLVGNLVSARMNQGVHEISFTAEGLSSGVYYANLAGSGQSKTIIIELLK